MHDRTLCHAHFAAGAGAVSEFCKGDRVRLSEAGVQALEPRESRRSRLGMVRGFSRNMQCVLVHWDGNRCLQTYHRSFLEHIPADDPPPPEIVKRFSHVEITQP
jgi:hypothetical protein